LELNPVKRLPYLAGSLLVAIAVSSCSSSQDVLAPSAIAPLSQLTETEGNIGTVPAQTVSANASASLNPAIASRTKLHFDPIVGATVEAATPLAEQLAVRAKARGLALAGSTDPSTTHVLKGYFSTMTEGRQTFVLYVWDVYDRSGNRLHRINGQQKAGTGKNEGWSAVSAANMQSIADDTIDQLAVWLASSTG
jgi:hypothetical protein